jgi:uncharacterized membrane protein YwaF
MAALPFSICEFLVTVAIISLSNKSTIWSPNWFCSNLVTLEWNSLFSQVIGTYGKGEKNFLNSSMKTISQTLIMSWLGKNYQWAMVEGSSGLSAFATLKPSDIAALPFSICEFFVIVAIISLSNKSTIWSPNWFCSNLVTFE